MSNNKGFTLVELIVAIGLFSVVMTLSAGAYLIMINANRNAQAITTGINNLSFALDSMSRNIRTGTNYQCPSPSTFKFKDQASVVTEYSLTANKIQVKYDTAAPVDLTDSAVNVSVLAFDCLGVAPESTGDKVQAHVTVRISGTVQAGPGKTQPFNVQTSATMRGIDL